MSEAQANKRKRASPDTRGCCLALDHHHAVEKQVVATSEGETFSEARNNLKAVIDHVRING